MPGNLEAGERRVQPPLGPQVLTVGDFTLPSQAWVPGGSLSAAGSN